VAVLPLLGPADLDETTLRALVAARLEVPPDALGAVAAEAEVAAYDLESLTTAGRYRVSGTAETPAGARPWSFFVKVVQSWGRSPAFAAVPEPLREQALASLDWAVEPAVYRTTLAERLPDGLAMPRAYAVHDLDDASAAMWLEDVAVDAVAWTPRRFATAARLLGRLAASPAVAALAGAWRSEGDPGVRGYAEGRVAHQVVPSLHDDAVWCHPLVAATFPDGLRERLLVWAARLPVVVDALEAVPQATLHGDACTRNLLVRAGTGELVVIDFGFLNRGPVGFDLGQLLLGEVQLGERPAAELAALDPLCTAAYRDGLADEGMVVEEATLWRAHALQMVVFSALSSLPYEYLGAPVTPALLAAVRERALATAWVLDLADAT
jgi:hypothetical protein